MNPEASDPRASLDRQIGKYYICRICVLHNKKCRVYTSPSCSCLGEVYEDGLELSTMVQRQDCKVECSVGLATRGVNGT
ncbi:hypothetical protein MGG_17633 [Pyricularia oryzae 70-15]|uniref:Uncharacterized protein n=4 Tax=Pyricularia oryzae TaxID=318829 RepID=G4NGG8_PYRO7|nr:uncharacterized protein MGG_17633 [Pyricularia oryzae 70-15]ELQ41233.1 hypothetical protein OOU_Y34scaffold00290g30 [Pyricularia oryzae Y34]KAH8845670.1 hypothetical protein MCOR01_002904 [Pyricularia oryzae]EHA47125.1 hypothetical protein MGG_17633 [Pyricularia oryzae 70-15]KAI6276503.1 hypothetical protein MCOR26_005592 [Pyricularia oryzae]KAI6334355.1 hypothetical protein MCOR29_000669 [Pyricularia oryzae]